LVFAVASLFLNLFREVVKTRKLYIIIFLLTVFLLTTILFNSNNILALYVLLSVPFSVLLANFFNQIKREWLAELYFTMLCLGIAAGYFL
jgi:cobalamin synthase